MDNIKFYEVNPKYIDYLLPYAPHLFHNKKPGQQNERKYIGVVLSINGFDYFAPLSSFKEKHKSMKESIDFIKVKNYCVIQDKIRKNANTLYFLKKRDGNSTPLSKRCNDFERLEIVCTEYIKNLK